MPTTEPLPDGSMAPDASVSMPEDWGDHLGWEAFYAAQVALPEDEWNSNAGSIGGDRLSKFVEDLKSKGWKSVWIPGCGMSPLARILAHLGMYVCATDVSASAIRFQNSAFDLFSKVTRRLGPADPGGSFAALVHDFRHPFRNDAFDLIINTKAFQGFNREDMGRIAGVHAASLREGRAAYFDTLNVQGERRDRLEESLEHGGFTVPIIELNRWYRKVLGETGIPHLFILGRPMIPRTGAYMDDALRAADTVKLRAISAEFESRVESEWKEQQERVGPKAKFAHVIYSTG